LSTVAVLAVVWLLAATIGRLPFEGFSNSADDAFVVQFLDHHLPPVPAVLAEFNREVDANSSPQIFVQPDSRAVSAALLSPTFQSAIARAAAATVRITSFGCGGIVSGSGFAVGPGLVATNAHVIAGVHRPIIKADNHSYVGVPVVFNPNLDFAVLRVKDLNIPSLKLTNKAVNVGTTLAVAGYPDGNYAVVSGVVRINFVVYGRNIYDEGVVGRNIYELQTQIDTGSSGGPIVLSDGDAAGIVFAKSDATPGYGYAITSPSLLSEINQAKHNQQRVSTGVCLA